MNFDGILKGRRVISLFNRSYRCYLQGCSDLEKRFEAYSFSGEICYSWRGNGFTENFRKNFFSIMMTSILSDTEISRESVVRYTEILTCLRQIVTSVDNIIDDENKSVVFFKGRGSTVVNNSLISIVCQSIMGQLLREAGDDGRGEREILEKLHRIAMAEGRREVSHYEEYPSPEYIVEKVHEGIGGELLEMALTLPGVLEECEKLPAYRRGLYYIGMALQRLDDLCDMEEDLGRGKINLGVGEYLAGNPQVKYPLRVEEVSMIYSDARFIEAYLDRVGRDLRKGFEILQSMGYPLEGSDLRILMRYLFKIRGMEGVWENLEERVV